MATGMRMDNVETFEIMLRIDKHRLDDELEIQPEIMQRIGDKVSIFNSRMLEAADLLKRKEASCFADAKENGDSDKIAEQSARRHPERIKCFQALQSARSEYEQWQVLYESWKTRGYSLKELVSLYSAQYFSIDSNYHVSRKDRPQNAPPRREYSVPTQAQTEEPRARRRATA